MFGRRFKYLLLTFFIIGLFITLLDQYILANKKLSFYAWTPLTSHERWTTDETDEFGAPVSVLPISKQPRLTSHERWIMTTDERYSRPETVKFGEPWSVLPLSKQSRCSVLSKDLPEQVIKAIEHGARYIFLTTHLSASLQRIIPRFQFHNTSSVVQYAGNYQNPLTLHFHGAPDRNNLNKDAAFNYRFISLRNTSLIQKLVQPTTSSVKFDDRAPPMLLPPGKISSFDANNVLFDYGALWALTPDFGEDIQWSIIVQRLLQELNDSVLFTTAKGIVASACSQPSGHVSQLQTDLQKWQCKDRTSGFFYCITQLGGFLVERNHLKKSDSNRITNWLDQLKHTGYKEPKLRPSKSKIPPNYVFDMIYYPPIKLNFAEHPETRFKKWCSAELPKCPIHGSKKFQSFKPFDDLLLVLLFNRPKHYGYLDYLENVYRPHFKYIIVCGDDLPGFRKEAIRLNTTLSFFQVDKQSYHDGYRNQQCLQHIITMGYDVNGYVLVNDDVLLNMWNLINMPREKVWYQQSIRPANLTQQTVPDVWRNPRWWPWQTSEGRTAITKAIDELKLKRKKNPQVQTFLNQMSKNAPGENRVFYEVSDMYYIPSILKDAYHYLISVFTRNNVYTEIAITTAICGITDRDQIHIINASYLWFGDRVQYRETFRYGTVFQHPIKYGPCFKDKNCTKFICEKYLPCVVKLQTL